MNWGKSILLVALAGLMATVMAGCGQYAEPEPPGEQTTRPEGWTEESHSNDADPNYDVVFPQDKVNQIMITIAPDDWEAMQANMAGLFGGQGMVGQIREPRAGFIAPDHPAPGGLVPDTGNLTRIGPPPDGAFVRPDRAGLFPGGAPWDIRPDTEAPRLPGWANMTPDNPAWVPATIEFNGFTWTNVGVRYKGNSSLTRVWREGYLKIPFKLDFDEFEDEYPEINNQRFYGFKQLSLSNAFTDRTYMHDVLVADILKEAGLVAAETAYYEVIMDYGEGPIDLGLYIVIEVIDDTVIDRFFGDDSGNIYEGDGRGVSLAVGIYNQLQNSFLKENNEAEADWSDIQELYHILHSEVRTSNPEQWRANLESIFDVDAFLEWLAIGAIIQHWDAYGSMPHNFYLYHNPDNDLLTWISWDHNQVLEGGGGIGAPGGRAIAGIRPGRSLSLGRDEVTEQWPLIRYLLDDPVYHERYVGYVEETINGAFNLDRIAEKCQKLAEMIEPYVKDSDKAGFESAVQELIDRVYERYEAATTFLAAGG